ncbi:16S rRNA (uracil(1498)-N(3))-methyltransferase [Facklamia sp. DSM 111018]|uniref:Ribosomal RNA small subunit methyltransferase E n=1 Tax=Facklamia lactis TaxID=2749967 RepID=A0ABS0LP58_9LACT|nr:16S rRNA (uracil(1498)-N(3))-methyltransferase [Facklamia lactis]MBG9980144.1 16S rRNA (uracil(1498)-N(3))-methyltransferase [Facklamia lactis]MBG9985946.1 16S rRNA (uracil(1498)-N(3))-methyltransferase [Facklamia lactis]
MQQYFIQKKNSDLVVGEYVKLSHEDSHHLLNVMRGQNGQTVQIVCNGQHFLANLVDTVEGYAVLKVFEKSSYDANQIELPVQVTIACGLSKNEKIEMIVQKATECGMAYFQPLSLTRDVVKWDSKKAQQKQNRLQKIAHSAAEQSKRALVPEILSIKTLKELLDSSLKYQHKWLAYEEIAKQGNHHYFANLLSQTEMGEEILFVFGSEGGLSEKEVAAFKAAGFKLCSLGPRILRAETAPIYALSAISYALEINFQEENHGTK